MKIVSAFFTKQCSGIAEELNSSKQVIHHLGAKLKGFMQAEGGVTQAISPPHFSQITPRCATDLLLCCSQVRPDESDERAQWRSSILVLLTGLCCDRSLLEVPMV